MGVPMKKKYLLVVGSTIERTNPAMPRWETITTTKAAYYTKGEMTPSTEKSKYYVIALCDPDEHVIRVHENDLVLWDRNAL
jgi:hypothetical protein